MELMNAYQYDEEFSINFFSTLYFNQKGIQHRGLCKNNKERSRAGIYKPYFFYKFVLPYVRKSQGYPIYHNVLIRIRSMYLQQLDILDNLLMKLRASYTNKIEKSKNSESDYIV